MKPQVRFEEFHRKGCSTFPAKYIWTEWVGPHVPRGRATTGLPRVRTTASKWRRVDWAFNGALDEPVHRWYRLTASFSPAFVRRVLEKRVKMRLLDPFAGVGTTLLESVRLGHEAVGVELNPFLHDVATLKTSLAGLSPDALMKQLDAISASYSATEASSRGVKMADWQRKAYHPAIPNLYAIDKWWPWSVLRRLLILRQSVDENTAAAVPDRMFFRLALAHVAMAHDRQTHTSLSYPGLHKRFEPLVPFSSTIKEMIEDLRTCKLTGSAICLKGNSRKLDQIPVGRQFDLVITSPPYCNRFTYTRQTRPMLYFLGYFNDSRQSGDLDIDAIGGTWGRATDRLRRVTIEPLPETERALRYISTLKRTNAFANNYAVEYFNALYQHLHSLQGHLAQKAELHYVIGNSYLYGVEVPADKMLGELMTSAGYKVTQIERVRRRHGKTNLYEAHVVATVST